MAMYASISAQDTRTAQRRKRDWTATGFKVLFLLPALAALAFYMYYPIEETFRLSLTRSTGLGPATYVGLSNYLNLFRDDEFRAGLFHVFAWAFWSVVVQIPLAFFVAYSLTIYKNGLTRRLRSIYYLANVLPSAVTALLGQFIFAPNYGVVASLAHAIGWKWLAQISFLGDPKLAFWSLFALATWAYTGFGVIYLMANIEQLPVEQSEAAALDGVNKWQLARYIIIPQISYALRIQAILAVVGSLKLFDLPYLVTAGGPGTATVTLGITLYNQGFVNWQYGKAAAIGVVIFLLSLVFTVAQFSLRRAESN